MTFFTIFQTRHRNPHLCSTFSSARFVCCIESIIHLYFRVEELMLKLEGRVGIEPTRDRGHRPAPHHLASNPKLCPGLHRACQSSDVLSRPVTPLCPAQGRHVSPYLTAAMLDPWRPRGHPKQTGSGEGDVSGLQLCEPGSRLLLFSSEEGQTGALRRNQTPVLAVQRARRVTGL